MPQLPECLDYKCVPLCPPQKSLFKVVSQLSVVVVVLATWKAEFEPKNSQPPGQQTVPFIKVL
jgi:hypothetical protein